MPWRGPEYEGEFPTLGWWILSWFHDFLPSPRDETKPLVLSDEQAGFILRWYALDPDTGEFLYRRGDLEWSKGKGKSPVAGANSVAELAGPVLFAGWDAVGEPIGRPWGTMGDPDPWVQIAAVSEDQTENTYAAAYDMLQANHGRAAAELKIDEGRTRLYLRDRPGRYQPVTAAAGSREGQPITHAVLDETWLWKPSNGGTSLAATLRRNLGKMNGRSIETTNAPQLGQDSVAEQTSHDAVTKPAGILYIASRPAKRPEPHWGDEQLLQALGEAYGDAWWVNLDRILAEVRDPATRWNDALRFSFNIPTETEETWLPPGVWEARKGEAPEGSVVLAFAGTYSGDSVGLVGARDPNYVFVIDTWESDAELGVDRQRVEAGVKKAIDTYRPRRFVANRYGWDTELQEWEESLGVVFDTHDWAHEAKWKIHACSKFYSAVIGGTLTHDGDSRLERALGAALVKETPEGAYITKGGRESARKVELAVAAIMAFDQVGDRSEVLVAWEGDE